MAKTSGARGGRGKRKAADAPSNDSPKGNKLMSSLLTKDSSGKQNAVDASASDKAKDKRPMKSFLTSRNVLELDPTGSEYTYIIGLREASTKAAESLLVAKRQEFMELEAKATALATEEKYEEAGVVQDEADALREGIKETSKILNAVKKVKRDAEQAMHAHHSVKDYRMQGQWAKIHNAAKWILTEEEPPPKDTSLVSSAAARVVSPSTSTSSRARTEATEASSSVPASSDGTSAEAPDIIVLDDDVGEESDTLAPASSASSALLIKMVDGTEAPLDGAF